MAGGKWAVLSASAALSLRGLDVHIVTSASKAQLLAIAVSGGYGCSLQSITAQSSLLGGAAAAAQWQERKGQSGSQHHVINYNVVLTDDCNQVQRNLFVKELLTWRVPCIRRLACRSEPPPCLPICA